MSDQNPDEKLTEIALYARTLPPHKTKQKEYFKYLLTALTSLRAEKDAEIRQIKDYWDNSVDKFMNKKLGELAVERDALMAENERLRASDFLYHANTIIQHANEYYDSFYKDQIEELEAQLSYLKKSEERIRSALLRYADSANWVDCGFRTEEANVIFMNPFGRDEAGYVIAKQALNATEEKGKPMTQESEVN